MPPDLLLYKLLKPQQANATKDKNVVGQTQIYLIDAARECAAELPWNNSKTDGREKSFIKLDFCEKRT